MLIMNSDLDLRKGDGQELARRAAHTSWAGIRPYLRHLSVDSHLTRPALMKDRNGTAEKFNVE